ncbi:60S ribosomal protein L14 [Pelomyxa schiedti]|nr:60S ribosomal protein L14 [Pelomyxa schiedti]
MLYKKFVQVGRVVLVNYGPDNGKLATIVDIIDENRVLIDGPRSVTGVCRQAMPLKRVALTDYVIPIQNTFGSKALAQVFKKEGVMRKWRYSKWFHQIDATKVKRGLTDFERFQRLGLRRKLSTAIRSRAGQILRERQARISAKRDEAKKKNLEAVAVVRKAKEAKLKKKAADLVKKRTEGKEERDKKRKEQKDKKAKAKKAKAAAKKAKAPKKAPTQAGKSAKKPAEKQTKKAPAPKKTEQPAPVASKS